MEVVEGRTWETVYAYMWVCDYGGVGLLCRLAVIMKALSKPNTRAYHCRVRLALGLHRSIAMISTIRT